MLLEGTRTSPEFNLELFRQVSGDTASAHSLEELVIRLVNHIQAAMAVDVCSLYQVDSNETLHMVANVGLVNDATAPIILLPGEGLVGQIAQTKMPISVPVASLHPAYRFFPDSAEDQFQAFLGVPVVTFGHVVGVLVVQDQDQRGFTADEEALLLTIAAQLADSMLRLPLSPVTATAKPKDRRITGVTGVGGKALGKLHFVAGERSLDLVEDPPSRGVVLETTALRNAVLIAREEVYGAKSRMSATLSSDVLSLFEFYLELLDSKQLLGGSEERIANGASAFAAVRATIDEYVAIFEKIEDEYLRARGDDVRHVGRLLLSNLTGRPTTIPMDTPLVLIGNTISVTEIAQYSGGQLSAVICLGGSAFSHTVILARALGIPTVVATGRIDHINEGDLVIVDGDAGEVLLNPSVKTRDAYDIAITDRKLFDQSLLSQRTLPCVTKDGTRITLLANTGLLSDIHPGKERGAEGIGLYRSEIPFLACSTFPTESEQYEIYAGILEAYAPLPVAMRTLDIGGDKQLPYLQLVEENPALGWRGIRFSLDNRAIFVTQLRAMLKAHAMYGNLRLMLPMVSTVAEVRETMAIVDSVIEQFDEGQEAFARPPLGIMVEVPGVVALLPHLAQWIDFISVGTNDLTQYLLAADRTNAQISSYFDFLHPAVLKTLADLSKKARTLQIDISVCGEMGADPLAAALLVGMGYQTLSMNAHSLPRIKALLRGLSLKECQALAAKALQQWEARTIRESTKIELSNLGLEAYLGD
ncbi:MAG: phosphoenolpyruvate-protein phosphotransferase [Limisphaerales bacterium]